MQSVLDRPARVLGEYEAAIVPVALVVVLRERLRRPCGEETCQEQRQSLSHCRPALSWSLTNAKALGARLV